MTTSVRTSLLALAALAACGAPPLPAARFANAPPVVLVDDRDDVARRPASRVFMHDIYHYDGIFQRRITRALELPRDQRARGVNALDEVPDSTWFTNRIGVRDLTPDEIRDAPGGVGSPEAHLPLTVHSTKIGGASVGFIVTDARGEKWILKFDGDGFPEQETGTHVIVDRLLWACGFNVTEDYVVYLRREELRVAPDAVIKDVYGDERPLRLRDFELRLGEVDREPDGRYRALASHWLAGKALGGHPGEGVRDDDPNDRIPHQLRRDLRGAAAIYAWLDHVDLQEGNFLDTWVADPLHATRHYVQHYLIDFGKSLGVMASTAFDPRHGHEYVFDFAAIGRALITLGLDVRTWEHRVQPALRGAGLSDADSYDPGAWKPDSPAYLPVLAADRFDKFWGAKIVARFTRDQLHAAVLAARFSDPRTVEYVTDTLVARQRATAAYWFTQVNPIDHVTATPAAQPSLCFDDLWLTYALGPGASTTRYTIRRFDFDGRELGAATAVGAGATGRACTGPIALAPGRDGYTIVEIDTVRPDFTGTTYVHLARDPAQGSARVIGIWRP